MENKDQIKVETAKRTQEEIDAYRAENLKKIKADRRKRGFVTAMAVLTLLLVAASWIIRAITP